MTQAERIISKFRTQRQLANMLGCQQSAVANWKKRGFIPANQQPRVLSAARQLGIPLTPADFFDLSANCAEDAFPSSQTSDEHGAA